MANDADLVRRDLLRIIQQLKARIDRQADNIAALATSATNQATQIAALAARTQRVNQGITLTANTPLDVTITWPDPWPDTFLRHHPYPHHRKCRPRLSPRHTQSRIENHDRLHCHRPIHCRRGLSRPRRCWHQDMSLKPCLDCGTPSHKTRCPAHTAQREAERDARRGTTTQRGLGWAHQQERAAQIKSVPYCERCGHTGSAQNPLTGEHGTARAHGGRKVTSTLCRSCNSSDGASIRRK